MSREDTHIYDKIATVASASYSNCERGREGYNP